MISSNFKKYLWDVDVDRLDPGKEPEYVIIRLLEYGDVGAVRWLLKNFDRELIKKTILKRRGLSPRSVSFWSLFFNLDREKILSLKQSYQKVRKTHWHY